MSYGYLRSTRSKELKTVVIDLPTRRHLATGLRHVAIGRISNEDLWSEDAPRR